jgi:hypothetical protein
VKPIPVSAATGIARQFKADQVIIIARSLGDDDGECCTTYGSTDEHKQIAAAIGAYLTDRVMQWPDALWMPLSEYNPQVHGPEFDAWHKGKRYCGCIIGKNKPDTRGMVLPNDQQPFWPDSETKFMIIPHGPRA